MTTGRPLKTNPNVVPHKFDGCTGAVLVNDNADAVDNTSGKFINEICNSLKHILSILNLPTDIDGGPTGYDTQTGQEELSHFQMSLPLSNIKFYLMNMLYNQIGSIYS